jgi:hypothetical protein
MERLQWLKGWSQFISHKEPFTARDQLVASAAFADTLQTQTALRHLGTFSPG